MSTADPTAVPKIAWSQRMAGILASSIALPLIFEILLALLGDESFNFGRAAVTVVVVGITAAGLYLFRPGWLNMQRARATFLILAGLGTAIHGFLVTAAFDLFEDKDLVQDVVGMTTLLLGVTVFAVGCFYFRVEDGQEVIENPRTTRVPVEEIAVSPVAGVYEADSSDRALLEACRDALSVERLHYIAMYEPPDADPSAPAQRVFSVDTFEQARYRVRGLSAHQRRELYHAQGEQVCRLRHDLDPQLAHLHTGPLVRLVLDVEQGAIYYYEVSRNPSRHLVAVTLDQDHVYTTDAELEMLKGRLRRELGLPRA
ncbi:hypothetical protein Cme02nite_31570 [Catellatospora methionotrophica]|uniref:Uncharacterized protein n=1 Tax=Catellatospora methionotrophica TaxID=121620 RepID=A0A8J3L9T5_9ACTN|nr:hypothetical protein [Catellatospora methionotrophica]GIG14825.1 hypothetical protein Cme02nite_31570 [Catellatospora methionotrophica]